MAASTLPALSAVASNRSLMQIQIVFSFMFSVLLYLPAQLYFMRKYFLYHGASQNRCLPPVGFVKIIARRRCSVPEPASQ